MADEPKKRDSRLMKHASASSKASPSHYTPIKSLASAEKSRRKSLQTQPNGETQMDSDYMLDPASEHLRLEVTRLENELHAKRKELEQASSEIKGLKLLNLSKDKAIEAVKDEVARLENRLRMSEKQLDDRALELKKANEQKKAALSAQGAAEAIMRRLQSSAKDLSSNSADSQIAPLEAQLKISRKEIVKLQEDLKAQERLMKNKEAALIEAEKTVEEANAKAVQVDDLMNMNKQLSTEIDSLQEEHKKLDKMYKQKVEEVHKLSKDVKDLEEALTAAGASASVIKDYQRQVQELQAHQRTLQEEVARAKVSANRVATVVANEWKDDNNKVIPIKQWIEERRILQGEIQNLKEKLLLAEKNAKYVAQMRDKFQLRVKVIEEALKSGNPKKELAVKPNLVTKTKPKNPYLYSDVKTPSGAPSPARSEDGESSGISRLEDLNSTRKGGEEGDEFVSSALYDLLQKEVLSLRKTGSEKDQTLKDKEELIESLSKKVEVLNKSIESEAKKSKRELQAMEKELALYKNDISSSSRSHRLSTVGGMKTSPSPNSKLSTTSRIV